VVGPGAGRFVPEAGAGADAAGRFVPDAGAEAAAGAGVGALRLTWLRMLRAERWGNFSAMARQGFLSPRPQSLFSTICDTVTSRDLASSSAARMTAADSALENLLVLSESPFSQLAGKGSTAVGVVGDCAGAVAARGDARGDVL